MNTMSHPFISSVLKETVEAKADELNQAKEDFKYRYISDIEPVAGNDTFIRVKSLLDDIAKLSLELEGDDDLEIIAQYVKQSHDGSISQLKMLKIEKQIQSRLKKYLNRLETSSLHMELMSNTMNAGLSVTSILDFESTELDDDFEVVEESELDEVLEKFEKDTFTTNEVDAETIEAYLRDPIETPDDNPALNVLRSDMKEFAEDIVADGLAIDQDFLRWCIVDLLKNSLVSEDKKKTLTDYLQSPIALRELKSTLNAKSIHRWNYKNADKGLPVTVVQNLEGQYCISIEESIVDLLFLYCMGFMWSTKLKRCLNQFFRSSSFGIRTMSVAELNKREYFLGRTPLKNFVEPPPAICTVCHPYLPPAPMPPPPVIDLSIPPPPVVQICPPPPPLVEIISPPRDRIRIRPSHSRKQKSKFNPYWGPPPPPFLGLHNIAGLRNDRYINDFLMSRLPTEEGSKPKVTSPEQVQAKLIKSLVVERKLLEAFNGNANTGTVQFKSLASTLPHQTILTVLKFLGVPEVFLDFFERFLSAKLNIGPAVRGAPDRVLPRACGVPTGHALEMFFTEAVMFFLEQDVHQKTSSYLYRLKDTCYFVGNDEQYQAYEKQIAKFANIMGLDMISGKSLSIGLLNFDRGAHTIKLREVVAYALRVKKQLNACNAVTDWVRVWNSTAGTYAAHLFGPLANVMGRDHLESVKNMYKHIFDTILDNGDLTGHVSGLLAKHLKPNIPIPVETFIYLPQAYGGLGVKNPFITLSLAQGLPEDPDAALKAYLECEDTYYKQLVKNYALLTDDDYARKVEAVFGADTAYFEAAMGPARDLSVFMTKEEFTAYRERAAYPALPVPPFPEIPPETPSASRLYTNLFCEPTNIISCSEKVEDELRRLSGTGDMKSWRNLSGEDRWVLQLYGDECFETYGGLEIWCGEAVPQEILKAVRGGWGEESDDDDASSVSDMTEP
jgi:hypothetical protein